eukprot:278701-Alexandrium_andersonii.AAC.1
MVAARYVAAREGFTAVFSPPCSEGVKASGGVGILVRKPIACIEMQPKTKEFTQAVEVGRAALAYIGVGTHTPLLVFSLYGWASAVEGGRFSRTDALLAAAVAEMQAWPSVPTVIGGDFNARPADLPTMLQLLANGALVDLGRMYATAEEPE